MNNLENMTIEEAHSLLVMRSDIVEQLIKLDKIVEGEVFVMGTDRERRIFLTEKAFMKFAKLFGKETDNILNVDDSEELYFFYTLHEKEYVIFCLPD